MASHIPAMRVDNFFNNNKKTYSLILIYHIYENLYCKSYIDKNSCR